MIEGSRSACSAIIMASRFALASPHSSTVRFFQENGAWEANVREFPPNLGKLVGSGGELLYFVGIMNGPSLQEPSPAPTKTVDWAQVTTWNPFTGEIVTLPRPPTVTSFPFLVRVQPFHRDWSLIKLAIPPVDKRTIRFLDPEGSPYFAHGDLPPLGGYIFTMVGESQTGATVMDCYYRYPEKEFWRTTPCDDYGMLPVSVAGLYPPRIVFKNLVTGYRVKFDAVETLYHRTYPESHLQPRTLLAELDDLHGYVFLQRKIFSPSQIFKVELHKWQGQAPELFKTSPPLKLLHAPRHVHIYGAKNAALFVHEVQRPGSNRFDPKVYLYRISSNSWIEVHGPLSIDIQFGDFEMAQLCETTISALASTVEVSEKVDPGASSSRSNNQGSTEGDKNV